MANAATSVAPVLLRARNFQWYWNSAQEPWSFTSNKEHWQKYTDVENEMIEDAFNATKFEVELDGNYVVSFKDQCQYKKTDRNRQFPIKRVEITPDHSSVHLREERFLLPVTLSTTSTKSNPKSFVNQNHQRIDIIDHYHRVLYRTPRGTCREILEDACEGIMKESIALGKEHEGRWLAQRLEDVKLFANDYYNGIPPAIGDTLVHLYTKDSFLYRLLNRLMRGHSVMTPEHFKNIAPFGFLLNMYLRQEKYVANNFTVVYRGINLTDEERKDFMQMKMHSTSFMSASKNREFAELLGNTLLIFDLDRKYRDDPNERDVQCGRDISHLSNFPEEEEVLVWLETGFEFVKYEYDSVKQKHIIYLRSSKDNYN